MSLRSESAVMSLTMKPVSVHQLRHLQASKMQISTARPAVTCGQHHPGLLDHRDVPAFKHLTTQMLQVLMAGGEMQSNPSITPW